MYFVTSSFLFGLLWECSEVEDAPTELNSGGSIKRGKNFVMSFIQ